MSDVHQDSVQAGPSGIGGWLVLPILGFIGTIALTVWTLGQALAEIEGLAAILKASSGPLSTLKIPVVASFLGGFLVIASAGYCLYLTYRKERALIKFATVHYLILMCAGFLDLWVDAALRDAIPGMPRDPSITNQAVRGVIIACIWIPYFHMSKRVRNTFTNPGGPSPVVRDQVTDSPTGIQR